MNLIFGHRPYIGKSKHEIKQLILTRQAHVEYDELPHGFKEDVCDFINNLIQRKPKNRLGKKGIKEVIEHSWFNGYDWNVMKKKKSCLICQKMEIILIEDIVWK